MVGIIIATHGEFAAGIKQSSSMILGEQEKVESVVFMPSEGPEDLYRKLQEAITKLETEEILFLVDLWGGSPFNQANRLLEESPENRAIVAGLNLPMLLEAYGEREETDKAHDVAKALINSAKDQIKVKPEHLEPAKKEEVVAVQATSQAEIPEGTVIGDGKLKIVLARIDTRLLHGQVATNWAKSTNPDRIIVVSDSVAKDELRKKLIEQAAPPGVKAHTIPLDKLVEVSKDTRFGGTKALLLFEKGVDIKELNIGSMAHSVGKVLVNNAISMDQKDVETYKKLDNLGVKFDVRKVTADRPVDLFKLISAKAGEGLKL